MKVGTGLARAVWHPPERWAMHSLPRDNPRRYDQPPPWRRGQEGKPMTVLVGIRFKNGLVVASESQETEEEYLKRLDAKKLYGTDSVGFEDAKVILAGTGDSAHIQRIVELIR